MQVTGEIKENAFVLTLKGRMDMETSDELTGQSKTISKKTTCRLF